MGSPYNPSEFILRSDSTCEDYVDDNKVVTFAGVFQSHKLQPRKALSTFKHRISDPHDFATQSRSKIAQFLQRVIPQLDSVPFFYPGEVKVHESVSDSKIQTNFINVFICFF